MWRTDSAVPEVAPAPAVGSGVPEVAPAPAMPEIAPAPAGGASAHAPVQISGIVSLTRLLRPKTKGGGRWRNGVMVLIGLGLVAGAVKMFVSSAPDPKVAAAANPAPAAAPVAQPATKPATTPPPALTVKAKPVTTPAKTAATAKPAVAKPAGGSPTAANTKPRATKKSPTTAAAQTQATGGAAAAPRTPATAGALGAEFVDRAGGYAVRFPAGWTRQSAGARGGWSAEAVDGKASGTGGSVALGVVPDGGQGVASKENLEALTRSFKAQPDTVVQGSGIMTLAGRKCMWHKLTLPSLATGSRSTAVHYFTPLGDGRALKVRVMARQEKFAETAPRMKQSLDTLRLLPAQPAPKQVAVGG